MNEGNYSRVVERAHPEAFLQIPSAPTVGLESMVDEVWRCVFDDRVGIIGICGSGGVGKTALCVQINNKLCNTPNNFDVVIWITASKDDGLITKIQRDIWERIQFFDEAKSMSMGKWTIEKVVIFHVLRSKKFVLFIDDLPKPIDLERMGVPCLGRWTASSKVIFTARSQTVCRKMVAHRMIRMAPLPWEQAWELFRTKVGEQTLGDPKVLDLAKLVAKSCAGLPSLIIATASSMAHKKTAEEWVHASDMLNESDPCMVGTETNVLNLLKFSYDSLPSNKLRECFLYCCLFPGDVKILKNKLIDLWICEEFLGKYGGKEDAHAVEVGYSFIQILIEECLLAEEEDNYVKMERAVRSSGLWVASESNLFKNSQLIDPTDVKILQGVGRISSMENFTESLDDKILRDLFTFFVDHDPIVMIKGNLLQFMEGLTFLDLSESCVEELPSGISKLVSLQHLNLSNTWIDRLPVELKKLVKLKCLNLEHNDLVSIPYLVISGLSSLQVLRMFQCGYSVEEAEGNILSARNMDISELQFLKNLKVLSITITCISALNKLCRSYNLVTCTHALSLEFFWGSKSFDISHLADMRYLATLEIHHAEHLRNIKVNFRKGMSFSILREVNVGKCSNLQDLTWLVQAPNLAILKVSSCPEMKDIVNQAELGEFQNTDMSPFAKLKVIELESLKKLKSIYLKALPFEFLEKIQVYDCPLLNNFR